jgi:tripartite-type tricarboxylate transporter receptor subunit TctC
VGTPKEVLGRLNAEVRRIVQLADVKVALDRQGMFAQTGTPEQFAQLIDRTIDETAMLVKQAGLKLE